MNPKQLMRGISKFIQALNRFNDSITEDKKELLNYPKTLEYLFNKPITKHANLKDALDSSQDNYVRHVRITRVDRTQIEALFFSMMANKDEYLKYYQRYLKCLQDYNKLTGAVLNFDTKLPYVPDTSHRVITIGNILDEMKIEHISPWSFVLKDSHVNILEKKPYNFNTRLEVDYYGLVIFKNRMTQFAIIYDHAPKKISTHDLLSQYYLSVMNINLLRVNRNSDLETTINKFIDRIVRTDKYVSWNGLVAKNMPVSARIQESLTNFYEDYNYNHILYLKYGNAIDEDNSSESEENIDIHNYSAKPCDTSYVISKDVADILSQGIFL